MNLQVKINGCYGIATLDYSFEFNNRPIIIHAPNGTFKTSFCKTILDYAKGIPSYDLVTGTAGTALFIKDGGTLSPLEPAVFNGYVEDYNRITEKSKALLLNKTLRKNLDLLESTYFLKRDSFFQDIKKETGFKNIDDMLIVLFNVFNANSERELINAINHIYKRIKPIPFKIDKYSNYFSNDIKKIVIETSGDIRRYNNLCRKISKKIKFIKEGVFDIHDFVLVAEELKKRNYFAPGNTLKLNGKKEVTDVSQLDSILNDVNKKISSDETIIKGFKNLQSSFKSKRGGNKILENLKTNAMSSKYYCDYNDFERRYFCTVILNNSIKFNDLVLENKKIDIGLKKIKKLAAKDKTIWDKTVETFNSRFKNKYTIKIGNKQDAVLGIENLYLEFVYHYKSNEYLIGSDELYNQVLSEGERKAFYMLDILFDVERFKLEGSKKLLIFDDITDTLDYTNKHCIIEYLKEIADNPLFNVLILTHNFDFYRHFGRKVAKRSNALFANSDGDGNITIENGEYLNNLFCTLKKKASMPSNINSCLALIPFARTNVENNYKDEHEFELDQNYQNYTKILHYRPDGGSNFTGNTLYKLFKQNIKIECPDLKNNSNRIYKIIFNQASLISSSADNSQKIEEKIVMSIALRIYGEKYMRYFLKKQQHRLPSTFDINNSMFGETFKQFKDIYPLKTNAIRILDSICILTPIEIHVNGFAYEPLIDYSITRLRTLFNELVLILPNSLR